LSSPVAADELGFSIAIDVSTLHRLVLNPAQYEGASTAPTPLGARAGLQLAGLPGLPAPATVNRPLRAYVALVEKACR